ncbi:MAG: hypothetical protein OXQ29_18020 [Rhodospirillaceae bacterium]|nr:hypothetical protein [Rhodospirillaceae bacterium]
MSKKTDPAPTVEQLQAVIQALTAALGHYAPDETLETIAERVFTNAATGETIYIPDKADELDSQNGETPSETGSSQGESTATGSPAIEGGTEDTASGSPPTPAAPVLSLAEMLGRSARPAAETPKRVDKPINEMTTSEFDDYYRELLKTG